MNDLFQNLFYDKRISELYTAEKSIQYLLDFEAHLAKSQAELQFIPSQFSEIIAHCCKVEKIDISQITSQVGLGGNIAIPLVKQLTSVVKAESEDASKFVHFGATSQDIVDTGSILQIAQFVNLLESKLLILKSELITIPCWSKKLPEIANWVFSFPPSNES